MRRPPSVSRAWARTTPSPAHVHSVSSPELSIYNGLLACDVWQALAQVRSTIRLALHAQLAHTLRLVSALHVLLVKFQAQIRLLLLVFLAHSEWCPVKVSIRVDVLMVSTTCSVYLPCDASRGSTVLLINTYLGSRDAIHAQRAQTALTETVRCLLYGQDIK
jgi:hypothetical protein